LREAREQAIPSSMAKIAGGAFVAAIAGAVVWALIAYYGKYELGILASGIGALVGVAVAFLANKNVNQTHQIISVVFGLFGVIAGKYITFYLIKQEIEKELGELGEFAKAIMSSISFGDMFEAYDILWIALAAVAAWTIPTRFSNNG